MKTRGMPPNEVSVSFFSSSGKVSIFTRKTSAVFRRTIYRFFGGEEFQKFGVSRRKRKKFLNRRKVNISDEFSAETLKRNAEREREQERVLFLAIARP